MTHQLPPPSAPEGHSRIESSELAGQPLAWAICALYQQPACILEGVVRVINDGVTAPFDAEAMLRSIVAGSTPAVLVPDELLPHPAPAQTPEQVAREQAGIDLLLAATEFHVVVHFGDDRFVEFLGRATARDVVDQAVGRGVDLCLSGHRPDDEAVLFRHATHPMKIDVIPLKGGRGAAVNWTLRGAKIEYHEGADDNLLLSARICRPGVPDLADVPA